MWPDWHLATGACKYYVWQLVLDALSTDGLRCTSIGNASVHGSSMAVGCYKYLVLTKVHGSGRGEPRLPGWLLPGWLTVTGVPILLSKAHIRDQAKY
jgi:hypothetical protein